MSPKENEKQFTVILPSDLLDRLNVMAKHASISRHKLTVNLLTAGIEEVEMLEHVGIFRLAVLVRDMTKSSRVVKNDESVESISEMPIPLRIDESLIMRLDRLAKLGDVKRQQLARNIIKSGLEELESAKTIGLTHLILKARDMHDLFKDFLEIGKRAFYAGKEVN